MSETLISPPISPLRRRMIEDMTVRQFVEKTGKRAAIGSLEDIEKIVEGKAGTNVVPA